MKKLVFSLLFVLPMTTVYADVTCVSGAAAQAQARAGDATAITCSGGAVALTQARVGDAQDETGVAGAWAATSDRSASYSPSNSDYWMRAIDKTECVRGGSYCVLQ